MGSVDLSRQKLTNLLTWELYLFSVPTLHETDKILRASLDNNLLSAKSRKAACSSFSTHWMYRAGLCGNTRSDFLEFDKIWVDTNILSMTGYQT